MQCLTDLMAWLQSAAYDLIHLCVSMSLPCSVLLVACGPPIAVLTHPGHTCMRKQKIPYNHHYMEHLYSLRLRPLELSKSVAKN